MLTQILCSSLSQQSTDLMVVCCMFHNVMNWPKRNVHHVNNFTGSSVSETSSFAPCTFSSSMLDGYPEHLACLMEIRLLLNLVNPFRNLCFSHCYPLKTVAFFPQFVGKFVTEILFQVCHFVCTQKSQLEQHTLMCSMFLAFIRCIKYIKDQQMHLNFIDLLSLYCAQQHVLADVAVLWN